MDTTPKKSRFKGDEPVFLNTSSSGYYSNCSQNVSIESSPKSEMDDNISVNSENFESGTPNASSPCTSVHSFEVAKGPKKRWLQAVQDEQLLDSSQDLAKPINWADDPPNSDVDVKKEPVNLVSEVQSREDQKRPTVLVCVQGGKSAQITNDDMQGAMALVELKNGQNKSCVNFNYRL